MNERTFARNSKLKQMEILSSTSLYLHIASGYLALVTGSVIMLLKKGNGQHKKIGIVFYVAMNAVVVSALLLSLLKWNLFLLHVAIFVAYQNIAGRRSITDKTLNPRFVDYFILLSAALNAIFMLKSLNGVLIVFGSISAFLVINDLRIYYTLRKESPLPKMAWLRRHIGMMMGAYIGAFTAFLTVNVHFVRPEWIVWIGPTVLFVPLMTYFTNKYTKTISSSY